jgi:hypothetical protein
MDSNDHWSPLFFGGFDDAFQQHITADVKSRNGKIVLVGYGQQIAHTH